MGETVPLRDEAALTRAAAAWVAMYGETGRSTIRAAGRPPRCTG
ncbi:hypothetical protein [Dactylosporangium darangshiense]|uniref:Uncharacterized protein n=1 Tax=Dactylosporangium darangshiense TaxID=579108 RepID=A0ABP8DP03_9ACTN